MTEGFSDPRDAAALLSPSATPQQAPAPPTAQPSAQPTPRHQSHKKGKAEARRRNNNNNNSQLDGAVSDSVLNSMASPQSKKGQKHRQQSVALPAKPAQQAQKNAAKQRPVSTGGNMLPATPLKEQAYAGPTFQASPAASALPMPKFFSKSVPNVAKHSSSLDARMSGQKTPEQESSPEPDVVSPQPPPRSTQQSPLDLFFNAQKAENQRKASMPSSEDHARRAPPASEPRNPLQQNDGKSVFLRELSGDSNGVPSPKTLPQNNHDRDAYNQSLKDLLFNGAGAASPNNAVTPPPVQRPNSDRLQSPEQQFYTPSPTQRSSSGPSTPTPTNEQQNHYSLHYGNRRNLSPLFKAAQGETPTRPSNLRQHSSAGESPTANGQQQQLDPNSFSRNYLDQHIRASQQQSTVPTPLGMSNGGFPQYQQQQQQQPYQPPPPQHNIYHNPHNHHNVQQGVPVPAPYSGTGASSPRTASGNGNGGTNTSSRDIRSMEDDLRRMLKVDVLGN